MSFSAITTLAEAGARTVAMVTAGRSHESVAACRAGAALRCRTPLLARSVVSRIVGSHGTVEAVEIANLETRLSQRIACDLVVFTADWIPDNELAVLGGISLDPGTRGPLVDASLRTTRVGVFAAGNILHGAEQADFAALTGRQAAAGILARLAGAPWPAGVVSLRCAHPLTWCSPDAVAARAGKPLRDRLLLRADEHLWQPEVAATQDGTLLWRGRVARLQPGRSRTVRASWLFRVDPAGGPVELRVVRARRAGQGSGSPRRREASLPPTSDAP